jgi:hypothetical protein
MRFQTGAFSGVGSIPPILSSSRGAFACRDLKVNRMRFGGSGIRDWRNCSAQQASDSAAAS